MAEPAPPMPHGGPLLLTPSVPTWCRLTSSASNLGSLDEDRRPADPKEP